MLMESVHPNKNSVTSIKSIHHTLQSVTYDTSRATVTGWITLCAPCTLSLFAWRRGRRGGGGRGLLLPMSAAGEGSLGGALPTGDADEVRNWVNWPSSGRGGDLIHRILPSSDWHAFVTDMGKENGFSECIARRLNNIFERGSSISSGDGSFSSEDGLWHFGTETGWIEKRNVQNSQLFDR